jgi:hypothetical protein
VPNGRLTFDFSTPVTSLTLSSASNALEVSDIAVSLVPEPSVWIMMLGGIAMMGAALRFGRKRNGLALAA